MAHPKYGSPARACLAVTPTCSVANIIGLPFRLDPVNQFYTWLGGVGALGFMVLVTVTCAAIVAFFRRGDHRDGHSLWRTTIAPAFGFLGMLGSTILTVWNLNDLVDGSTAVAIAVVVLVVGLFVSGFVVAKTRPETGMEGLRHQPTADAVAQVLTTGQALGTPTVSEAQLAKVLIERISAFEAVRFTTTGSEALQYAARIARTATRRKRVMKFEGAFHGSKPL